MGCHVDLYGTANKKYLFAVGKQWQTKGKF
jgi:hypothetical protein